MRHRFPQRLALAALALACAISLVQAWAASDHADVSVDVPLHLNARGSTDTTTPRTANAAVTDADVGDADSFGRNLRWLGLTDMGVELTSDCTGIPTGCQVLAAAPAITS